MHTRLFTSTHEIELLRYGGSFVHLVPVRLWVSKSGRFGHSEHLANSLIGSPGVEHTLVYFDLLLHVKL